MSKPITKDLIWEIMKKIQEDMADIRRTLKDIRRLFHRP